MFPKLKSFTTYRAERCPAVLWHIDRARQRDIARFMEVEKQRRKAESQLECEQINEFQFQPPAGGAGPAARPWQRDKLSAERKARGREKSGDIGGKWSVNWPIMSPLRRLTMRVFIRLCPYCCPPRRVNAWPLKEDHGMNLEQVNFSLSTC